MHAWFISSALNFLPFALREARTTVFERLFLRLALGVNTRRVASIDDRWPPISSAATQNVDAGLKGGMQEPRLGSPQIPPHESDLVADHRDFGHASLSGTIASACLFILSCKPVSYGRFQRIDVSSATIWMPPPFSVSPI
jgi:hypothetical protein